MRLHSYPFLPRAKEDVPFSLVAGVGLSLVTAPQHPHCAHWQTFLMLGLAHPQEQEDKWVCIVTPSLQGPALLCTPRHPIQPFRLVDTSMNGMAASPANSSKGLKDCPRSSHHQDQPAHLVHPPGGVEGWWGARLQRETTSPCELCPLQVFTTALPRPLPQTAFMQMELASFSVTYCC